MLVHFSLPKEQVFSIEDRDERSAGDAFTLASLICGLVLPLHLRCLRATLILELGPDEHSHAR